MSNLLIDLLYKQLILFSLKNLNNTYKDLVEYLYAMRLNLTNLKRVYGIFYPDGD